MDTKRFELITAGHHFLLDVLPFREPESRWALERFVREAQRISLTCSEMDSILIRCLAVMNQHSQQPVPSLVDRYLDGISAPIDCLRRFAVCIEGVVRHRGIRHGSVQDAIDLINARHHESGLGPARVAHELQMRLGTLCVAFKRDTGQTLHEYIRDVRLDHAATLLATTNKSIKEIWSQVGYNHPSNFDHDFKGRFVVNPTEYRHRILRPAARPVLGRWPVRPADQRYAVAAGADASVLLVDDDSSTTETIGAFLKCEGYAVSSAGNGRQGLRLMKEILPRAILLDYRLPDMTGIEYLRAMRSGTTDSVPPVALFTADWNVADEEAEALELGAIITSKLCTLELVAELVASLMMNGLST